MFFANLIDIIFQGRIQILIENLGKNLSFELGGALKSNFFYSPRCITQMLHLLKDP